MDEERELTGCGEVLEVIDWIHDVKVSVKLVLFENGIFEAFVVRGRERRCGGVEGHLGKNSSADISEEVVMAMAIYGNPRWG